MRMKYFRKLLLVWMIVWLPVAGAMAAIMPLSAAVPVESALAATAGDQNVAAIPCHGSATPGKAPVGDGCTHCVLCHLAVSLVMTEFPVVATVLPTNVYTGIARSFYPSFVPEPTSPPPRSLAI